jgi:hypothetical protein
VWRAYIDKPAMQLRMLAHNHAAKAPEWRLLWRQWGTIGSALLVARRDEPHLRRIRTASERPHECERGPAAHTLGRQQHLRGGHLRHVEALKVQHAVNGPAICTQCVEDHRDVVRAVGAAHKFL